MSQEANVLQRFPYSSLRNGVTCLDGDHGMVHDTILSIPHPWLSVVEYTISSFMGNRRGHIDFQERHNSLLIVHGKWLRLKPFWSLAWTLRLQGHLSFQKFGYIGLGHTIWVIPWDLSHGGWQWRVHTLGPIPGEWAAEKNQKEPHSFIDPSRLSRTRDFFVQLVISLLWQNIRQT